VSDFSFD
jgi:T-complex protein 1 subunit epsilon